MPTSQQMKAVAEAGVNVVINLAPFDPEKDLTNESALAESLGMKYVNIPVDWEAPTRQNLEAFMNFMDENKDKKYLSIAGPITAPLASLLCIASNGSDGNRTKPSKICAVFGT